MHELSRNQIDKLGDRLRKGDRPSLDDLRSLDQVRAAHAAAADHVEKVLTRLGIVATSRAKTTQTIVDKLRRERTRLSTMQDVVGFRTVQRMTLDEQDQLVDSIVNALGVPARVDDRRKDPRSGYRAVHVIADVHGHFIELQVRTRLQDTWAQLYERLADRWGRQIRYGDPPDHPDQHVGPGTRGDVVQAMHRLSERVAMTEGLQNEAGSALAQTRARGPISYVARRRRARCYRRLTEQTEKYVWIALSQIVESSLAHDKEDEASL